MTPLLPPMPQIIMRRRIHPGPGVVIDASLSHLAVHAQVDRIAIRQPDAEARVKVEDLVVVQVAAEFVRLHLEGDVIAVAGVGGGAGARARGGRVEGELEEVVVKVVLHVAQGGGDAVAWDGGGGGERGEGEEGEEEVGEGGWHVCACGVRLSEEKSGVVFLR